MHGSSICFGQRAILILGKSGSGKSSLALSLMALGATLISDDRTDVTCLDDQLHLSRPATMPCAIEFRGVGILRSQVTAGTTPLALVVDMDREEKKRTPPERSFEILGKSCALLHKVDHGGFPMAIKLYVEGGIWNEPL